MRVLNIVLLATMLSFPQTDYSQQHQSLIRSVDFASFTYPARPLYSRKSFRLAGGRYKGRLGGVFDILYPVSLVSVAYGDVTDDGSEEAMVVLFENVKGSAIPYYVYVFTLERMKPKVSWSFETGDRGDGGLRKVYAENGGLVVELYGKDAGIGDIANKEETGACCPKSFTRIRYAWRSQKFRPKGRREVLPNPLSNAELVMS